MTKTLIKSTLLAALVGTATFSAPVFADRDHWQDSRPDRMIERDYSDRYAVTSRQTLSIAMRERVHNETLPLRKMFGLNRTHRGQELERVVIHLKPNRTRGKMRLLINGQSVDREIATGQRTLVLDPRHHATIGDEVRSLKLQVRGKAVIRGIDLHLSDKGHRSLTRYDRDDHAPYRPIRFQRHSGAGVYFERGDTSGILFSK